MPYLFSSTLDDAKGGENLDNLVIHEMVTIKLDDLCDVSLVYSFKFLYVCMYS